MMVCWSSLPLFSMLLFGARCKYLLIETADKPGLSADQPEQEKDAPTLSAAPAKTAALALPAASLPPKSPPPPLPELDLKEPAPSALDNLAAHTNSAAAVPAEPAVDILSQLEAEFAGAQLPTDPVAVLPAVNAAAQSAAPVAALPAVKAAAQPTAPVAALPDVKAAAQPAAPAKPAASAEPVASAMPDASAKQPRDVDSFLIETVDNPTQGLDNAA
jgi:hypothetical protein